MGLLSTLGLARASEVKALKEQVTDIKFAASVSARKQASGVEYNYGSFEYETQQNLTGSKKWDTLSAMEADAHIKGALRSQVLPLVSGKWEFKSASDKPKDVEVADFCNAVLLRKSTEKYGRDYWTMTSWKAQRLLEIADMMLSGFSMFQKTYRAVGVKQVIDLHWLEPSSVDPVGWILDDQDNIVEIKRTFRSPQGRYNYLQSLPSDQIALYVWDLKGARFEGRPFVRSMYGAWYRKDMIVRLASIWAQKVGAPVPTGYYPKGWGDEERNKFIEFVQSLRGSAPAHAFGVFPLGEAGETAKIEFAGSDIGEVDRMRGLWDGENAEIAHAGGQKSQLAGETAQGSRAVASTQQDAETPMVQAFADTVAEWENHGVANITGVVEDLVMRNFAGVKDCPQLCVSKLGPDADGVWASRIEGAVKAGILPKHPDLKRQYAERFGIVLPDDAYEIEEPVPVVPGQAPAAYEASLAEEIARIKSMPEGSRVIPHGGGGAKPRGWFRAPTEFESQFVALGAIEAELTKFEQRYYAAVAPIMRSIEADIVARVKSGRINRANFSFLRSSKEGPSLKYEARVRAAMKSVLNGASKFGMEQVKTELAKQAAA